MPTLIAQLSDPHLRRGPEGPRAAAAFGRAIAQARALPVPPDVVLVTGDVADSGHPDEYALARELLSAFEVPVHVLPGNHDEPGAFASAFGDLRWAVGAGDVRVIGCDTRVPGSDAGSLDLVWLEDQLAADTRTPTIVALHHPPVRIGIPALDAIGLPAEQRAALAALLEGSRNVRRVIAGHVHRTVVDTLGGCGVFCCTSTNQQARLEIGATEFDIVDGERPAFALHVLLDSGELVSHVQPVAD